MPLLSMKTHLTLAALMLLAATPIKAQTHRGPWARVEAISPNSVITVITEHKFRCFFDYATETELSCIPRGSGGASFVFARDRVREVRVEHIHRSTAVGIGIGAGIGIGIGAGTGGSGALTRPATAIILGGAFGALGGYIGRRFSFSKSTVIYRR